MKSNTISMMLVLPLMASAFTVRRLSRPSRWAIYTSESSTITEKPVLDDSEPTAVRAPLKYIGPYPALALRFPNLATQSQRTRNATGISLDFVLDTAANTNTINAGVASELGLEVIGQALPGVGASGALQGGATFLLGDAELEGLEEKFTFMTGLSASALPVASPAAAGLLSLAFLQSFPGVDFRWGSSEELPSVTFLGHDMPEPLLEGRTRVPIERIPVTQLPLVMIQVNGVAMPALLDTGSPITVLNAQAAEQAGVATIDVADQPKNPLAAMAGRFQQAQAAARGDVLTIVGAAGERVNLLKTANPVAVQVSGESSKGESATVDFGEGHVYVGDLPGLAALNGLGVESPPAVVLGMDVLRQRPSMLLRAQNNEVWF